MARRKFSDEYKRALAIREKGLRPAHPDVATSLNSLALLYYNQGRYAEAEPLYQRSLAINKKALGSGHPHATNALETLAELYRTQGRNENAEHLLREYGQ